MNRLHPCVLVFASIAGIDPCRGEDTSPPPKLAAASASIQWVNEPTEKQLPLPPGVQHLRFRSELAGVDISYCIYLPEAYEADPSQSFPVIYNLHGNGGNEFTGLPAARLLDDQIRSGDIPPMIMVMFNGGKSTFYMNSADGRLPIESIFMDEFIPHIDATYRTIADGSGRCIEGFSMGGRGSTRLAMKYPTAFCSLFCQAGNVPRLIELYDTTPESQRSQLLRGDDRSNYVAEDVYTNCTNNQDLIEQHLRIQIACGTQDDGHLPTIRDFHAHLVALGVDHTYIELENLAHRRTEMMRQLGPVWFDYHVESLRRRGTLPPDS
ncbi:MAG: alpha/beta hydrolase-fold protein [Planctomycetota bacterium]